MSPTASPYDTGPHEAPMHESVAPLKFPETGREMLTALCGYYGYTLSQFEALMWGTQILGVYRDDQVVRALIAHIEGPAPERNFMPKYGAIKAMMEPEPGLLELERLVRTSSPYEDPAVSDPTLTETIRLMGGWDRVCHEMPDSRERPIDFAQYSKRIERALAAARQAVLVRGHQPAPLLGLVSREQLAHAPMQQHTLGAPGAPVAQISHQARSASQVPAPLARDCVVIDAPTPEPAEPVRPTPAEAPRSILNRFRPSSKG